MNTKSKPDIDSKFKVFKRDKLVSFQSSLTLIAIA